MLFALVFLHHYQVRVLHIHLHVLVDLGERLLLKRGVFWQIGSNLLGWLFAGIICKLWMRSLFWTSFLWLALIGSPQSSLVGFGDLSPPELLRCLSSDLFGVSALITAFHAVIFVLIFFFMLIGEFLIICIVAVLDVQSSLIKSCIPQVRINDFEVVRINAFLFVLFLDFLVLCPYSVHVLLVILRHDDAGCWLPSDFLIADPAQQDLLDSVEDPIPTVLLDRICLLVVHNLIKQSVQYFIPQVQQNDYLNLALKNNKNFNHENRNRCMRDDQFRYWNRGVRGLMLDQKPTDAWSLIVSLRQQLSSYLSFYLAYHYFQFFSDQLIFSCLELLDLEMGGNFE